VKVVTAAEMRAIDRATSEQFGIASLTLMERAGSAVAEFTQHYFPNAQRIGVICGKGNNGGDGFVAARRLHEMGREVLVLLLADPATLAGDAAGMAKRLPVNVIAARGEDDLKDDVVRHIFDCDLLLDAIFGTGFKPPLSPFHRAVVALMRPHRCIAVDIPSGADCDAAGPMPGEDFVHADATLTFTAPKLRHALDATLTDGQTVVVSIGSPPEAIRSELHLEVTTAADTAFAFRRRARDAHKGDFGHVLIVGGSLGKSGAAGMAALAALRTGCGLATVATAASALPLVAAVAPELMTEPLPETDAGTIAMKAFDGGRMDALLAGKDAVAIGPGLGRHADTAEFVRALVARCEHPMVLDADGLNAFAGDAKSLRTRKASLVVTPHPGEMARLLGVSTADVQKDRLRIARDFARAHDCTVVLKGSRTITALPSGEAWVNPTGNPGMATGGTGDVLTGIATTLVAQDHGPSHNGLAPRAAVAAYLHGVAGDLAAAERGEEGLIATDLIRHLPAAIRKLRERVRRKFVRIG
jgi:ADP-dependent NAD(P)H-hydrate dehydratase / NAD(P)H-hydrate epimerase